MRLPALFFASLFLLDTVALAQETLSDTTQAIAPVPASAQVAAVPAGTLPRMAFSRAILAQPAPLPEATGDTSHPQGFTQVKPKLLPDNMSWFERTLWGEEGTMRKIGLAGYPLTPDARKSELTARRTMLTMHQIGGFVTLGLMGATVYYGQKYLDHLQRNDRDMHQTFLTLTLFSYGATGALSILSPPPLIRRDEASTTSIHKTLAWVHFAGMVITPILGNLIERRSPSFYDKARIHQVSGYITAAIYTASMVVMTF